MCRRAQFSEWIASKSQELGLTPEECIEVLSASLVAAAKEFPCANLKVEQGNGNVVQVSINCT